MPVVLGCEAREEGCEAREQRERREGRAHTMKAERELNEILPHGVLGELLA